MKILVIITFIIMVAMNALANILPINGITTGAVSDSYANLFAPAGITFAIWGIIYLALGIYVVYQALLNWRLTGANFEIRQLSFWFSISSIINAFWILAWHYNQIGISVALMLGLLFCLIRCRLIVEKLPSAKLNRWVMQTPFSIYFGWITVATVANITTLLVKMKWDGFGISEPVVTAAVILISCLIASATTLRFKDRIYAGTVIWAFAGILYKHVSASGFNSAYPVVIIATAVSLLIMSILFIRPRLLRSF